MLFAFVRLLLIALTSLICIVLVVFGLRSAGLQQNYSLFTHNLVNETVWLVAEGGDLDQGPEQSPTALKALNKLNPRVFVGLKIQMTKDGEWILYSPKLLEELTSGTGYVGHYTLAELKKLTFKSLPSESLLSFKEALLLVPDRNLYVEVLQPGGSMLSTLFEAIKEFKLEKKIVLNSPFLDTLRVIRRQSADWLTGTANAEIAKFQFMNSIYLETTSDLPGEVFVAEPTLYFKDSQPTRLLIELLRRKKIVLQKIRTSHAKDIAAESYKSVGILTMHPSHFVHLVDSGAL